MDNAQSVSRVRVAWDRLMVLDARIQAFLKEVAQAFEIKDSHPVTVVFWIAMVLAGTVVCLFVLPLYRTFGKADKDRGGWAKGASIIAHSLIFCVAFSPIAITNSAANKFGTGALCEICGRPGEIFWSRTSKGGAFAECFCERHRDHAESQGGQVDSQGKDAAADLGLGTGVNVFFLLAFWGLGTMGTALLVANPQEKALCIAFSLLPLTLLLDWHFYGQWITTILGPTR